MRSLRLRFSAWISRASYWSASSIILSRFLHVACVLSFYCRMNNPHSFISSVNFSRNRYSNSS
jgi:hypothetical protein